MTNDRPHQHPTFAKNLKHEMASQKIDREYLAAKCGTGPMNISRWTTGSREPSLLQFWRLSKALNVPADFLLMNRDE